MSPSFNGPIRAELTHALIELLESWGLSLEQMVPVLGLAQKTPVRKMRQYQKDQPLPEDPQIDLHIEHLIGIEDALRTMYPLSVQMSARWMRRPCRRLGGRSPVEVLISTQGADGLVSVRAQLDCTFSWDMSGSRKPAR